MMSRESTMEEPDPTTLPFVWDDDDPEPKPEPAGRHGSNRRRIVWASVTVLALVGSFGTAHAVGLFSGGGGGQLPTADVSVGTAMAQTAWAGRGQYTTLPFSMSPSATASASATASHTPSAAPSSTSPAPSASPAAVVVTPTPTVLAQTVSLPTTQAQPTAPMPVTTPAEKSGEAAAKVSGYVQCQSQAVEGVYIEASNGGSGWAPWVSSAARSSYATYSYTLANGGEYSVWVGCGGTPKRWTIATYSSFYGGTVNDFLCYDQTDAALYTYCVHQSS